ncbi:hypothetical protein FRC12_013724 [Ceratobasidium sp. 428]|nr:hypothetical protein FRC12_013724 [Ceratobasidium sp. 428]
MSNTRDLSQRLRRPSDRFVQYEGDDFPSLSQSVGRPNSTAAAPSSTAVLHTTQQPARKGKSKTTNHDDLLQPDELPPTKRRKGDVVSGCILDKPYESLATDQDRLEWLFQAIEQLGDTTDFRGDPDYQDVGTLREVFDELRGDPHANDNEVPPRQAAIHVGPKVQIRPGALKTLGVDHRGATTLVPTKNMPRNAPVPPSQPKTSTTNKAPSKPQAQASTAPQVTKATSSAKTAPSILQPTPAKAKASGSLKVSRARFEELRKEAQVNKSRTNVATAGSSGSNATPKANVVDLHGVASSDEEIEVLDQNVKAPGGAAVPAASDDDDGTEDQAATNAKQPTKREQSQLSAFDSEYSKLVDWVLNQIKLKLALEHGWPEVTPVVANPPDTGDATVQGARMVLDDWLTDLWPRAHDELRSGKPRLPIESQHVRYIRKSLAPIRNHDIRAACDGLVPAYFGLHQSNPDHIQKAKGLLLDEAWLSSNLANDDFRFQHDIIRDAIHRAWFSHSKSLGSKNLELFTPLVPLPTIAYTCSIVRQWIEYFKQETNKGFEIDANRGAAYFRMYMKMLNSFGSTNSTCVLNAQLKISLHYVKGNAKKPHEQTPQMNIGPDHARDEARLAELENLLGCSVNVNQPSQPHAKGKNRAGPSRDA